MELTVCRPDIHRDSTGLSSRDRQADGGEHCMITLWEPWIPADALMPPVGARALCLIHVYQLSIFLLLQLRFSINFRKREDITQGELFRSLVFVSSKSHQHEQIHKVSCWQMGWLTPLMTRECRHPAFRILHWSKRLSCIVQNYFQYNCSEKDHIFNDYNSASSH